MIIRPLFAIFLSVSLIGCASFDLDLGSTGVADISQIAPRADGGPNVSLSLSTSDFRINFGSAPNVGKNYQRALDGSGYFSQVKTAEKSNSGVHIDLKTRSYNDTGALSMTSVLLSIITVYVIPQTIDTDLASEIQIWNDGELLETIRMNHSVSVIDSSLPFGLLFGSTGESAGEAYAAALASHTIEALNRLNLL